MERERRPELSEETLRKKVSGQGWKTTDVYQINQDKEVIKEYVLVTGGTISSARNETFPDYLIFSDDSQSVSFYEFWDNLDKPGAYETDPFTYDATDNAITLPIWFGSWGGNGRLVFLSSWQAKRLEGKVITVRFIDSAGMIHLEETGIALLPGVDEYEIVK